MARRFGELGATVAVMGRSQEKTAAVAAQVGGRVLFAGELAGGRATRSRPANSAGGRPS
ncbi:hypothetical protein [Streptomyces regalis]|uniref:hypothetical protein n=1 Tax=Streptomyces regalis TaxID=68262 RepID=UPI00131E68F4|nr:hypothetical protein [Streptomyces regalis]